MSSSIGLGSYSVILRFCSLLLLAPSPIRPEFVSRGATADFYCDSQKSKSGEVYPPILKRNDDHHKDDPVNLFFGDQKRPVIDSDWSVNKTENATTGITRYSYHLENVNFEDAGIYVCDDLVEHRKNLTVLGDRVICKDGAINLKQGELIDSSCELQVDGPDAVDLAWFMNDEKLESKLKPIKPEDHSITISTEVTAQPKHHNQLIECRYSMKGKAQFKCEVSLRVEYPVQIKGKGKSVYHEDFVEAEIHVIGNPWPGKSAITVKSDHIDESKTEKDELDNGFGAEVTVHIPVEAFKENPVVNVIILANERSIGSLDIKPPEKEVKGKVTYIVIIVVLAIAAILLAVAIVYFLRRSKSREEDISTENKNVPMAEQPA